MFLLSIIFAFLLAVVLMSILRNLAVKANIYDNPQDDVLKIHKKPVPLIGGVGMLIANLIALGVISIFVEIDFLRLSGILICGFLAAGLGLWDDLRWKNKPQDYRPNAKFTLQVLVSVLIGIILFFVGFRIKFIPISIFDILLGIFYIFGAMNAVNMQDGIDGLAGGLAAISALGFGFLAYFYGSNWGLILSLTLLGSVTGFLIYNFPPASIFMGDSGSHFLGFMLATLAILFTSKPYNLPVFIGPILIIGLPVFDAAYVVIRRLIRKKPLFQGDRGHFYDRLMYKGFSLRKTLAVCYLIQVIFVTGGIILSVFYSGIKI
jgi:UDP-GlcNAc:undecaprenyl-phosphate GlcNAc-1-phosphate transferase